MAAPKQQQSNALRKLLRYFIQGIIILAPIGITIYALYWLFQKVDGILRPFVNIPGLEIGRAHV